jgi:hypothetical protein
MFVTNITDELILELDVIHVHDAYVDWRRHVLQLGNEEVSLCCPGGNCIQPPPLEAVDSLAGMGSRAAHEAEARMLVQPSRKVPVAMTRGCQFAKAY